MTEHCDSARGVSIFDAKLIAIDRAAQTATFEAAGIPHTGRLALRRMKPGPVPLYARGSEDPRA